MTESTTVTLANTSELPLGRVPLTQKVLTRYDIMGEFVNLWLPAYVTALSGEITQVIFNVEGHVKEKPHIVIPEGKKVWIDETWNYVFHRWCNTLAKNCGPVEDKRIKNVYWFIMHTGNDGVDRVMMTCDTRYDTFEDIARKYPHRHKEIVNRALDSSPQEDIVDRQSGIIYESKTGTKLVYLPEFRNSAPGGERNITIKKSLFTQKRRAKKARVVDLEDVAETGLREVEEETGVRLGPKDFCEPPTYFTAENKIEGGNTTYTVYAAVIVNDEAAHRLEQASHVRRSRFLNIRDYHKDRRDGVMRIRKCNAEGDILDAQGHRIPLLSEQAGSAWVPWSDVIRSARTNQPFSIMKGLRPHFLRSSIRILLRNFSNTIKRSFELSSLDAACAEAQKK
jgi:hypothetical protein